MKLFKFFFYYTITAKDCSNSFLKTLENHVSPKVLDSNTVLGVGDFVIYLYVAFFKFHNLYMF